MVLPSNRKALLRRAWIFAGVIVLGLIAVVLTFHSNRVARRTSRRQNSIAQQGTDTLRVLLRIQYECTTVLAGYDEADLELFRGETSELIGEMGEHARRLAGLYSGLGLDDHAQNLRQELQGMQERARTIRQSEDIGRQEVASLAEDVRNLEDILLAADAASHTAITDRTEYSRTLDSMAWVCLLLTVCLGLMGVFLVVSDVLNESLAPVNLEEELEELESSPELQVRLRKLLPDSEGSEQPGLEWKVELTENVKWHRTHITFEAVAKRGQTHIKLWGKRYRWAGVMKSFQRVFEPGFGRGTWNILCRMYNQGFDCPFPVAFQKLKRGPFTVGAMLLAEHLGTISQVKTFLRTDFMFLNEDARMLFVEQMVSYWNRLHDLGLHSLSPRYLHGKNMDNPEQQEPGFYLFDLDKVGLSWGHGGKWHNLCVALDNRRLRRFLRDHLSAEEMARCEELLDSGATETEMADCRHSTGTA